MTAVTTLPWGRLVSADDFFALDVPDDGRRYELVDGVLVVTPSPSVQHQRAVRELLRALTTTHQQVRAACFAGGAVELASPFPLTLDLGPWV